MTPGGGTGGVEEAFIVVVASPPSIIGGSGGVVVLPPRWRKAPMCAKKPAIPRGGIGGVDVPACAGRPSWSPCTAGMPGVEEPIILPRISPSPRGGGGIIGGRCQPADVDAIISPCMPPELCIMPPWGGGGGGMPGPP